MDFLDVLLFGLGMGFMFGLFLGLFLGIRSERYRNKSMYRWARTRRKGMWHFVILYGMLGWGSVCGVLNFLVHRLIDPIADPLTELIVYIVGFLIGGFVWGILVWYSSERAFLKWRGEQVVLDY